ncbi:MAG: GAF domain-containing protein [Deltaproteobacteria bacterium]|nr:GAF domain-containing protein [Deltaproteobacteria bacterium]
MTQAPVDLTSCDKEPIHIPGAIQPHGVLLAFDAAGRLAMRSANAPEELGEALALGEALPPGPVATALGPLIALAADADARLGATALSLGGRAWDVVPHRSGGLLVVELEARWVNDPALEEFALRAQAAIARVGSETVVERLLEVAVEELRGLTGFDRVMAYRFQPDDSGLVAAESKRDDLVPYRGHRYPATDIPAQARRLYTINALRLIVDVGYEAVPVEPVVNPLTGASLDLSHSVLRSVSPIHIEYLTNMGVGASMSISLVVGDRLWGLLACHHMGPMHVPYAVRMACNVMAQVVSLLVGRAEIAAAAALRERSMRLQTVLVQRIAVGGDPLAGLLSGEPSVQDLVPSDGVAVALGGEIRTAGETPSDDGLVQLLAWLRGRGQRTLYATHRAPEEDAALAAALEGMCGVLATPFFPEQDGYVLWFRKEEIETVRWGGRPEKDVKVGPLGPRLTPRGSFEEWRETVRGRSRQWLEVELQTADRLGNEMRQVSLAHARARIQSLEKSNEELDRMTYVVSHDLRAPLRAIASLSEFVEQDMEEENWEQAAENLRTLRGRVVRLDGLIRSILAYSRAGRTRAPIEAVDVAEVVTDTVAMIVPDGVAVEVRGKLPVLQAPRAPLQQIFLNLIDNAVKYGTRDGAGRVEVRGVDRGSYWQLTVADEGPGLGPEHFERVFQLFNRVEESSDGTGIGLATVRRVVETYGGRVWVESAEDEGARFHFTWPKSVDLV